MKKCSYGFLLAFGLLAVGSALAAGRLSTQSDPIRLNRDPDGSIVFSNARITLTFDAQMGLRIGQAPAPAGKRDIASSSGASHFLTVDGAEVSTFELDRSRVRFTRIATPFGAGKRLTLSGVGRTAAGARVEKTLRVELYAAYPDTAIVTAAYRNVSSRSLSIDRDIAGALALDASTFNAREASHEVWSFHGSSIDWGKDEFIRLKPGFSQQNYSGVNRTAEYVAGGGLPFVDFWTREAGLALAHIGTTPKLLSLPVQVDEAGQVRVAVLIEPGVVLEPRGTYTGPTIMLSVHDGDFATPLARYSQLLQAQGWKPAPPNDEAYEPSWCGWGYEFDFTPAEMLGVIPKLKELGVHWATIDDRWFVNYGDWQPRPEIFPGGVRGIRDLVSEFHRQGVLVQLWWYPLVAEAGRGKYWSHTYTTSDVVREHPEWLITDEHGRHPLLFRDLPVLCPAVPGVRQYTEALTRKFLGDWDFDGLKLDVVFTVPPCHNKLHNHNSPEDSVRAMAEIYRTIYETSLALKPNAVVQICPCGTPPFFPWAVHMNQAVTADPVGAWQVRSRIKMYKALLGPRAAVYADHVEWSGFTHDDKGRLFNGDDFASAIGAGGVIGTRFVWPAVARSDASGRETLTPNTQRNMRAILLAGEREEVFKKWFRIYNEKKLAAGEYLNLYDIVHDKPEAHVIRKDGRMYYGFFADTPGRAWSGEVRLRGLDAGAYRAYDYVRGEVLGDVQGPDAALQVTFIGSLLIEVTPLGK